MRRIKPVPVFLIFFFCLFSDFVKAQDKGILPFTGLQYFKEGLDAGKIDITLDGSTWTSNRLPIQTEFVIKLEKPTGFRKDTAGRYFPGLELLILNNQKDTLGYAPNMYLNQSGIGFDEFSLDHLKLTLGFNEKTKPGDTCRLLMTFFDLKGPAKLRMVFPVIITAPDRPLDISNYIFSARSFKGYNAFAIGVEMGSLETYIDSLYFPQSLYHSIRVPSLKGLTVEEGKAGTYQVWFYDDQLKPIKTYKTPRQYIAQTENTRKDQVNILLQVPLDPRDPKNLSYTVRYRWESADGKKVVDVVNRFTGK